MKCLTTSVIAAGLLAAAADASAAPALRYERTDSMLTCRWTSGYTTSVNAKGVLQNSSTVSAKNFICPIERQRDNVYAVATSNQYSFKVNVTVVDQSSAGDFSCKIAGLDDAGSSLAFGAAQTSTGKSTAAQILTLTPPSSPDGFFQLHCSMPKRGSGDAASTAGSLKVQFYFGI